MSGSPNGNADKIFDVEEVFPSLLDGASSRSDASGPDDVGPRVSAALRDALGWRPRLEDPKSFVDALTASFRLVPVEGHVEAQFVPRGYAVQADLGAVTGGQASLYRRATISRTEMLRIVDGLVPLRTEADPEEMAAYRSLVRNSIDRLVDEWGTTRVALEFRWWTTTSADSPAPSHQHQIRLRTTLAASWGSCATSSDSRMRTSTRSMRREYGPRTGLLWTWLSTFSDPGTRSHLHQRHGQFGIPGYGIDPAFPCNGGGGRPSRRTRGSL